MKIIKNLLTLFIISLCLIFTDVYASSFSISVGSKNITKGGKTTLKIKGSDAVGRFNISTSNSSVVTISESYVWVENNSVSISLSALKNGSATITVTAADVSNNSGSSVSLGSKSVTINVTPPREKSTNNYLKDLKVDGYDLVPVFDKDTLEYNVSVPSTIDKVNISATKADNYASLSGIGEFEVQDGINTFEITVTSETGAVKVYSVNVTVEDLNPITVKTNKNESMTLLKTLRNIECPANYVEQSISIDGITIPTYYNEQSDITLVGLKDSNNNVSLYRYIDGTYSKYIEITCGDVQFYVTDITNALKGYITDKVSIDGSEVAALKVSKNSKFAVLYGINIVTGKSGYYTYDINNKTIQAYDSEMIDVLNNKNTIYSYIVYASCGALLISLILNIILGVSNSKKNKKIKKYIDNYDFNKEAKEEKHNDDNSIVEVLEADKKVLDEIIEEQVEKPKKSKKKKDIIQVDEDELPPEIPDEEAKISLDEVLKEAKEKKKSSKNTK